MRSAINKALAAIVSFTRGNSARKEESYPIKKINTGRLTHDVYSGVSLDERKRRLMIGYYDEI
ncbi:MAG: hypothetical protein IJ391_08830 [Clostridia bacterium]|nr:hypothetical protein [Clostridia bacterium]